MRPRGGGGLNIAAAEGLEFEEISMRKTLHAFAAAGFLGAAGLAFAAGPVVTATGKVKSVDLMRHTVTFENGSTYKIARGVRIGNMKPGERVTPTFAATVGPVTEASAVTPAAD
jgi:hypothetical protein